MILIGMQENEKKAYIKRYLDEHKIKKIIVISGNKFPMNLTGIKIPVQEIDYNETIMYRTFYPFLSEIDKDYLIILNEILYNGVRKNLNYNCIRHYLNQCGHQLIFEYFPFIENKEDFMILYDFDTKSKYIEQKYCIEFLENHADKIKIIEHKIEIEPKYIELPANAIEEYDNRKNDLFKKFEIKGDPDNIPRALEIYCGKWKKKYIEEGKKYIARNARYKKDNVTVYKNAEWYSEYILLDFAHRRRDFNDFLKTTGKHYYIFISTGLSVDVMYVNNFNEWREKYYEFLKEASEAGICIKECSRSSD